MRITEAELLAALRLIRHRPQKLVGGGDSGHYETDHEAYVDKIVEKVRGIRLDRRRDKVSH